MRYIYINKEDGKTLYVCDPLLNTKCEKRNCYFRMAAKMHDRCYMTKDKASAMRFKSDVKLDSYSEKSGFELEVEE